MGELILMNLCRPAVFFETQCIIPVTCHQFVTLLVHLCVQDDGYDAARGIELSAAAQIYISSYNIRKLCLHLDNLKENGG